MAYNIFGAQSRKAGADASIELVDDSGVVWSLETNETAGTLIVKRGNTTVATFNSNGIVVNTTQDSLVTTDAAVTLTQADAGKTILATKSSATQTFTLPAVTVSGVRFTFCCGDAGGEILINPAGSDDISCKATNDAGAAIDNTSGTGLKNTAGTNVIGDYLTIVSDGTGKWYTVGQSGIWASQS